MGLGRSQRSGSVVNAPGRGELIWLTFTPQSGPALVVSPSSYNSKVGLALVCPITSKVKGYPFEVPLPDGGPVQGVVLADQLRSLDGVTPIRWTVCRASRG
jgi:mRNA interferase MazF